MGFALLHCRGRSERPVFRTAATIVSFALSPHTVVPIITHDARVRVAITIYDGFILIFIILFSSVFDSAQVLIRNANARVQRSNNTESTIARAAEHASCQPAEYSIVIIINTRVVVRRASARSVRIMRHRYYSTHCAPLCARTIRIELWARNRDNSGCLNTYTNTLYARGRREHAYTRIST